MHINDGWVYEDMVTGLTLAVTDGKKQDKLRVTGVPGEHPRDFFFTKAGNFDGTGSLLGAEATVDRAAAAILAADIGIPTSNADYPAGMCVADCVEWLIAEVLRLRTLAGE